MFQVEMRATHWVTNLRVTQLRPNPLPWLDLASAHLEQVYQRADQVEV